MRALREDELFALFRHVRFHDADAAQRFGQPSRHLRVDLAALAEERAQALERGCHPAAERAEDQDRDHRQLPVEIEQDDERDRRGQDRSGELHEARADEIPDAFRVGHDARDEDAGLRRVEIADRQAHDVRLDLFAHLGDRALRRDAEHLRVRERGRRIDDRRRAGGHGELRQQLPMALLDHVVHQVLRRRRQHEAGEAVDEHQAEAESEPLAVRPDQPARFFPCARREGFLRRLGNIAGCGRF